MELCKSFCDPFGGIFSEYFQKNAFHIGLYQRCGQSISGRIFDPYAVLGLEPFLVNV